MGGRGASSGSNSSRDRKKLIDDIFDIKEKVISNPIEPSQFANLKDAENKIQDKEIENIVVFNNTSEVATAAFSGGKHSVGIPESVTLSNMNVTHNHPDKGWGGTLSMADMKLALTNGVASIRAVGRENEGVYALVKSNEARPKAFFNHLAKDGNNLKSEISRLYGEAYQKYRAQGGPAEQVRAKARQEAVGYLHKYYKQTAEQYGYIYTRQKRVGTENMHTIQPVSDTKTETVQAAPSPAPVMSGKKPERKEANDTGTVNRMKKGKVLALFIDRENGADKEYSGFPALIVKEKSGYIDGDIGYYKETFNKYHSWVAVDIATGKKVNTENCNTLKEAKEDVIRNIKGIEAVRENSKYKSEIEKFNNLLKGDKT